MDGQLRNCSICSKAYVHRGGRPICEKCRNELDLLYVEARNFLRDHPRFTPTVAELALVLGVDERKIGALKDDGRLQVVGPGSGTGWCQICGDPCRTGHLCPRCLKNFSSGRASPSWMGVLSRRCRLRRKR